MIFRRGALAAIGISICSCASQLGPPQKVQHLSSSAGNSVNPVTLRQSEPSVQPSSVIRTIKTRFGANASQTAVSSSWVNILLRSPKSITTQQLQIEDEFDKLLSSQLASAAGGRTNLDFKVISVANPVSISAEQDQTVESLQQGEAQLEVEQLVKQAAKNNERGYFVASTGSISYDDYRNSNLSPPTIVLVGSSETSSANNVAPPNFEPWPPPRPTDFRDLYNMFQDGKKFHNLANIQEYFETALEHAGVSDFSYFSAPGGFAIVTPLTQLNKDGSRETGSLNDVQDLTTSDWFKNWVTLLFYAPKGYYGAVVLFVTTDPRGPDMTEDVTQEQIAGWCVGGKRWLPDNIRNLPTSGHFVYADVYDFEQTEAEAPQLLQNAVFNIDEQLKDFGIVQKAGVK